MERFILRIPRWEGKILFNIETVGFLLTLTGIAAGLFLCFWGYKYFRMFLFVLLGCAFGVFSIWAADQMTRNMIIKMWFFVIFIFLGLCFFQYFSSLFLSFSFLLPLRAAAGKNIYLISALLGGGVVGFIVYAKVYRSVLPAIALFFVFAAGGAVHGKRKAAETRAFHTYDDLCRLKPQEGGMEENNA